MKNNKLKRNMAAIIALTLLIGMGLPTLASSIKKNISVITGVTVYLNDTKISTKDANGKLVEPFIYEGTTYLPVRAIADALGVPVAWEQSNQGVYLGKHEKLVVPEKPKDNKADWVGKYKEVYSYVYGPKQLTSEIVDAKYIPYIELRADGTSSFFMNLYYVADKFEGVWEIDKNNPNKINIKNMRNVNETVSFVKDGKDLILSVNDCIEVGNDSTMSCNKNMYRK